MPQSLPSSLPSSARVSLACLRYDFVIHTSRDGLSLTFDRQVINAALLSSAWSAASSDLYTSSRALYGLSISGNAPKIFSRLTKNGLPLISIIFNTLFAALAYMATSNVAGRVFGWFVNSTCSHPHGLAGSLCSPALQQ